MDYTISFGYRHILSEEIVMAHPLKLINVHISYLPWNRGADPNLWSFLENTPKGVSIHLMDEGVDTGPLLSRRQVAMSLNETLATSYQKLTNCAEQLLMEIWPRYIAGEIEPSPQELTGTTHKLSDKQPWISRLTKGWDTPVSEIEGLAVRE